MNSDKSRYMRNYRKARFCHGCAWLHIGVNVDHNHCDYTDKDWDELEKRANGHFEYINGKLSSYSQKCGWFWDKKLDPAPSKTGFYYKNPNSSACPKIPIRKKGG